MSLSPLENGEREGQKNIELLHPIKHLTQKKGRTIDLVQDLSKGRIFVVSSLPSNGRKMGEKEAFAKYAINHPTIASFHPDFLPSFSEKLFVKFAVPFYTNGSLKQMIEKEKSGKQPIEWNNTKKSIFIFGFAFALKILHTNDLCHGCLSPSQIFLSAFYEPLISGYWLRDLCDVKSLETPDSKSFVPDETFEPISKKTDIFSYGAILCSIIRKTPVYDLNDENPSVPDELQQLIRKCLEINPDNRPDADIILSTLINGKALFKGTDSSEFKDYVNWLNDIKIERPIVPETQLFNFADEKDITEELKNLADAGNAHAQLLNGINRREGYGCSVNKNAALRSFRSAADAGVAEAQYCSSMIMGIKPRNAKIKQDANNYLVQAAENGFTEAMLKLGTMLARGETFPRDIKRARQFLTSAAENGSLEAQMQLAELFKGGAFGAFDNLNAMKYYRLAALQGDDKAQYEYAKLAIENNFVENIEEGLAMLYRSTVQGNSDALLFTGKLIAQGKMKIDSFDEELDFLKRASEAGQKDATNYYSQLITNKTVRPKDPVEATKYLKTAAESGNAEAIAEYAERLLNGIGIKVNQKEALKYFFISAEKHKNPDSAYYYAELLIKNNSGWTEEASRFMKIAADAGNKIAIARYGYHLKGLNKYIKQIEDITDSSLLYKISMAIFKGHPSNSEKRSAVKLLKNAADLGNSDAQRQYATLCYKGKVPSSDTMMYFDYLKLAADQGDVKAQCRIGNMLSDGDGCEQDPKLAIEYFEKAASQGSSYANYALGLMYEIGDGCKADLRTAIKYMKKATTPPNGTPYNKAKDELKRMESGNPNRYESEQQSGSDDMSDPCSDFEFEEEFDENEDNSIVSDYDDDEHEGLYGYKTDDEWEPSDGDGEGFELYKAKGLEVVVD